MKNNFCSKKFSYEIDLDTIFDALLGHYFKLIYELRSLYQWSFIIGQLS